MLSLLNKITSRLGNLKNFLFILLAVIVGIFLGMSLIHLSKKEAKYAVVVFRNGNIYFGKLSWFPRAKLSNVVFIQVDQNGQIFLQRFSQSVYQPKDFFYFNPDEVFFWSYLEKNSPIINFIEQQFVPSSNQTQPTAPSNQPTSSDEKVNSPYNQFPNQTQPTAPSNQPTSSDKKVNSPYNQSTSTNNQN